ncbi:MAG: peptidoglycan-binding protein, partial [Chloroflexi bacterium]|nr:peptidoglycan-binding protein [Chloroflexota bacterium]
KVLPFFGAPTAFGGFNWVYAYDDVSKQYGYVRSDCYEFMQVSPTPDPSSAPNQDTMGYIVTIKSEINIRKTPSSAAAILGRMDKARVLPLTGAIRTAGGYNWFQISSLGQTGYLRGDCVRQMTAQEVAAYLANGTIPSLTPAGSGGLPQVNGYVMTTLTSVNVRKSPSLDAATLGQIAEAGMVFPYYNAVDSGGRMWYKISYSGAESYLLGSTARLLSVQEYTDYLNTLPTPTPPPAPTPTPRPEDMSATAITRMEKVIVRSGAGSANRNLTLLYRQGTVVELLGPTVQADGQTWHEVRVSGINGWIRGDLLRVLTKEEEAVFKQTGDPDSPKTATYRELWLASTGEDVTRLQQELNRLGYLQSAYITGTYDDQTAAAVRAFQQAKGLIIDGRAGSATQHKLYNTVPEGTYDPGGGGTVSPEINPVELVDWVTGDISTYWGKGETAVMTDVDTKISLRVRRWSGLNHVDGEPLTSSDTAALCRIYKVKSAQEILEKNLYQRRAVW